MCRDEVSRPRTPPSSSSSSSPCSPLPSPQNSPRHAPISAASLTPYNVFEAAKAFLRGLADSLMGPVHAVRLDTEARRRRDDRRAAEDAKVRKEQLLRGRDGNSSGKTLMLAGSPETLAKRRAVIRRQTVRMTF